MRRLALALSFIALGAVTAGQPSALIPSQAPGLDPLPRPWLYADIGAVGLPGSAGVSGPDGSRVFTIQSAGDNIWGEADSFGYAYRPCAGDCEIIVRVTDLQDTNPFAKAGVMVRETLDPDAAHAVLDVRPTGDVEFMTRQARGASTSFVAGTAILRPTWLMLIREGPLVTAYARAAGDAPWTTVGSTNVGLSSTILIGLAVTSGDSSRLNSATLDSVLSGMTGAHPLPSQGWYGRDIGDTGAAGSAEFDAGTFTVRGSGADIWDQADAFHFLVHRYPYVFRSHQIVARVTGVENTDAYAKAGVMVRTSGGGPDAANVLLDVRPTGDIELTTRTSRGEATTFIAASTHALPVWLRLTRTDSGVAGSISSDGLQWTAVGTASAAPVDEFGLVVASHSRGILNTSTFDMVAITSDTSPAALPNGWRVSDVGSTGLTGDGSYTAGIFTVRGAGEDIWGTADSFQFVGQSFDDDFSTYSLEHVQVGARVTSVQNTNAFAKAGVMIRNFARNHAGGAHVMLDIRPTGDIEMLSRPAAGAPTTFVAGTTHGLPVWLKLVRSRSTFTGYISADGSTWTTVGTVENNLDARHSWQDVVSAGLAVTSRDPGVLNSSTFDHAYIVLPIMQSVP
jgi:hypothetical protein